jgi:hypothetical protein
MVYELRIIRALVCLRSPHVFRRNTGKNLRSFVPTKVSQLYYVTNFIANILDLILTAHLFLTIELAKRKVG